jgi:hypothetical protein
VPARTILAGLVSPLRFDFATSSCFFFWCFSSPRICSREAVSATSFNQACKIVNAFPLFCFTYRFSSHASANRAPSACRFFFFLLDKSEGKGQCATKQKDPCFACSRKDMGPPALRGAEGGRPALFAAGGCASGMAEAAPAHCQKLRLAGYYVTGGLVGWWAGAVR